MSSDPGEDAAAVLTVGARFNGPSGSANGGYLGGLLAGRLGAAAVRVTLRRPPPLETPLRVEPSGGTAVRLLEGEEVVAEAETAPIPAEAAGTTGPVPLERARRAERRFGGWEGHPFPTCFVCGPDRAPEDGLRLFAGPVDPATPGRVACVWHPSAALLPPGREEIPAEFVWAALDCPGGWSSDIGGRPMVLGRMTVAVRRVPAAGRPHVITGHLTGTEGRKVFTSSALHTPEGELLATARATWILLRG